MVGGEYKLKIAIPKLILFPKRIVTVDLFFLKLTQSYTNKFFISELKEDILNKMSWTDEGYTYFRMDDFYSFCKRNNWEMDKTKTGNLIKQLVFFEDEIRMTLKNQTPRLVKIKAMKKTTPSISPIKYEEAPF